MCVAHVLKPGFSTCAYTPQQKMLNYRSYWEAEFLQENLCWLCISVGDFPWRSTFGPSFLATRVQTFRGTVFFFDCACRFHNWDPVLWLNSELQLFSLFLWNLRCALPQLYVWEAMPSKNHDVLLKKINSNQPSTWLRFRLADVHAGAAQAWCGYQTCSRELRGSKRLVDGLQNICVLPSVNKMSGFCVLGNGPLLCQHTLDHPPPCSPPSSEFCNELMGG